MKANASEIAKLVFRIALNSLRIRMLTAFSKLLRFGYRLRRRFKKLTDRK